MSRRKLSLVVLFVLAVVAVFLNQKFEIIAFHPFFGSSEYDLKVMTWNVHCSNGTDSIRQRRIADLILQVDADFVLLNEYNQDSCRVTDSLLRTRYPYTEECQSHNLSGNIFYSKRRMSNSGQLHVPSLWRFRADGGGEAFPDTLYGKPVTLVRASVSIGSDSVQIIGCHWPSNSDDGNAVIDGLNSLKKIDSFYEVYKEAQSNRVFQAKWTKEYIKESKHPVIVMGDMNDFNCSAPLDTLTSCGLKDAWWEGGTGYGCTFHAGWMWLRIDHVLYESLELKDESLKLTGVKVISTDLSDHNPIVAEFKLKR